MVALNAISDRRAVLIIEDDAEIQETLATLFTEEGYQVVCASNGAQGLAQLAVSDQPLVVLLDLTMPVMDGFEVCRRLAADPDLRGNHALVLMTAHRQLDHPELAIADAVIAKPFDVETLLALMERLRRSMRL